MRSGWHTDDVERRYSVDQIVLLHYIGRQAEIKDLEIQAKLNAAMVAKVLVG